MGVIIYATVQTIYDYMPILLLPWAVSATFSALLFKAWDMQYWYLCFVPGLHTPIKLCYALNAKWPMLSVLLFVLTILTRSTELTLFYIITAVTYNVVFVRKMFVDYVPMLPIFGLYRLCLYGKEVSECRKCNKAKSTKKKSMASKEKKTPSTKTRKPISK